MAHYHPSDDWLAAYASGAADEQIEALIAGHLTLCPVCRESVAHHEEIAGVLFDAAVSPLAESPSGVEAILKMPDVADVSPSGRPERGTLAKIAPVALVDYVHTLAGTSDIEKLNWTDYCPGIKRAILIGDEENPVVRLVEAQPGSRFPKHGHATDELTLILTGAYRDQSGRYAAGDVQCATADLTHQPLVEDDEVCYAFIAAENAF